MVQNCQRKPEMIHSLTQVVPYFLDPSSKVKKIKVEINQWEIKAERNQWGLIKHKSFCRSEETIDKMKRQLIKWEKIFANDLTNQGLISNIYYPTAHTTQRKKTTSN